MIIDLYRRDFQWDAPAERLWVFELRFKPHVYYEYEYSGVREPLALAAFYPVGPLRDGLQRKYVRQSVFLAFESWDVENSFLRSQTTVCEGLVDQYLHILRVPDREVFNECRAMAMARV